MMETTFFECDGLNRKVRFWFTDHSISISWSARQKAITIDEDGLSMISCRNHPWLYGDCSFYVELEFSYIDGGKARRKDVVLNAGEESGAALMNFLQTRYQDRCRFLPSERERREIIDPAYQKSYALHHLHILTPLGVIQGVLVITILLLYLMMATTDPAAIANAGHMKRAGIVILFLSLFPAGVIYMIMTKRWLAVKTDFQGIRILRCARFRRYPWDQVQIRSAKSSSYQIYRGLYCEASDQGEVVARKPLIEVRMEILPEGEETLKLPLDEAGHFYRELYYRKKVSYEEAQLHHAFPEKKDYD